MLSCFGFQTRHPRRFAVWACRLEGGVGIAAALLLEFRWRCWLEGKYGCGVSIPAVSGGESRAVLKRRGVAALGCSKCFWKEEWLVLDKMCGFDGTEGRGMQCEMRVCGGVGEGPGEHVRLWRGRGGREDEVVGGV